MKFNSNDDFPLNKPLKFHAMTIIIRSVFEEDGQLYPHIFLDDALYVLQKCYSAKKLCQTNTSSISNYAKFGNVESFKGSYLKKHQDHDPCSFAYKYVCNKCLDVLMTAYELNVKGVDFRCISRDEAVNRLHNSVLDDMSLVK